MCTYKSLPICCTCAYIYISIYLYTYIHTYIHVYIHIIIHIHIYVYARVAFDRTLMVTSEDIKRLGVAGLLRALSSNQKAAISAVNEHSARTLIELVLNTQLAGMLSVSSTAYDGALLARLSEESDEAGGGDWGVKVEGMGETSRSHLLTCVRHRMVRKQLLSAAMANLRDTRWGT